MKLRILNNIQWSLDGALLMEAKGEQRDAYSFFKLILEATALLGPGHEMSASMIIDKLSSVSRDPADALFIQGMIFESRKQFDNACIAFKKAVDAAPAKTDYYSALATLLTKCGSFEEVRSLIQDVSSLPGGATLAAEIEYELNAAECMPGEDYYALLSTIHDIVRPRTYLEIGLGHGKSLALAGNDTVALGVDPVMADWDKLFFCRENPSPRIYPLTSNDFFSKHNLPFEMGQDVCDLAFIDGLHLFEQALMDFANVERFCTKTSVILLHDCLPINPRIAQRERCTGLWTGDVWKVIPCLKAVRPDLTIITIPAFPSGLAIVTNLNPLSRVIGQHFDQIVEHFVDMELPEPLGERMALLGCVPCEEQNVKTILRKFTSSKRSEGSTLKLGEVQ